jgi:hypothetical protein
LTEKPSLWSLPLATGISNAVHITGSPIAQSNGQILGRMKKFPFHGKEKNRKCGRSQKRKNLAFSRIYSTKGLLNKISLNNSFMKEPGLDNRHRDKKMPKIGEIQRKRSDALNKNLSVPIPNFSGSATVGFMRKATGKIGLAAIRKAAKKR